MTRRGLARLLTAWATVTLVASAAVHVSARGAPSALPPRAAQAWALDVLDAAVAGRATPPVPAGARAYRAAGPIVATAWVRGAPMGRFVGDASLVATVERAARAFSADPFLRGAPHVETTLAVTRARAPFVRALAVPFADGLTLVPLRDGLLATLGGRRAVVTPDDLLADGTYDRGLATPIPDLTLGADAPALTRRLALDLGAGPDALASRGTVERLVVTTVSRTPYPRARAVTAESLLHAATLGARFLLRHESDEGRFTYVYDGRAGAPAAAGYSTPRHAGAAYFLALLATETGDVASRDGARRALGYLAARTRACGDGGRQCVVEDDGTVDFGSSALAAVAAAAYLEGDDDAGVRALLTGLAAFLRGQQRPDGELMHGFDLARGRPVDVQLLYYSGEGALALALAGRVLRDPADTRAAERVLARLVGEGWAFFGSRYYFGEEHWTCSAAAALRETGDVGPALDFCRRWAEWSRRMQYRRGETPWDVAGTYGVGNVVLPRLTPVASRTEAFVSTFELAAHEGVRDPALRPQVEAGLSALLRWQWDPGPTWLLADPGGARGAIPGSPADLTVRDDYLQHAGCAMVRWAHVLRAGPRAWATP